MNARPNLIRSRLGGLLLATLLASSLVSPVLAGPGVEYFRNLGTNPAPAAPAPEKTPCACCAVEGQPAAPACHEGATFPVPAGNEKKS